MTDEAYNRSRAEIIVRIIRHEKRLADGRYIFPRCLAADYRELDKLDKLWQYQQELHHTM